MPRLASCLIRRRPVLLLVAERQELFTKDWPLPLSLPGVRWAIHSRICQKHGLNPREVPMQAPQPYADPQPPADLPAIAAGVGTAGMHDAVMQAASGAGGPKGLPAHMPAQHGTSVRMQGTATRTRKVGMS